MNSKQIREMTPAEAEALSTVLASPALVKSVMQQTRNATYTAEKLGVSLRTVQRLCKAGKLGFKIGKQFYITDHEIANFTPPVMGRPQGSPNKA